MNSKEFEKTRIYQCPECLSEGTDHKDNICPECWIKEHLKIKMLFSREIYMKKLEIIRCNE